MTQTVLDTTGSLASLLLARTDERPDHPFLWVEEDGPWTLADLATSAASVAADLEVGPGDRVLLSVARVDLCRVAGALDDVLSLPTGLPQTLAVLLEQLVGLRPGALGGVDRVLDRMLALI